MERADRVSQRVSEILFLAHRVPFPPNRGDKIRAHHLLQKLAQLGPVHVGCFAESAQDRACAADLEAVAATHCLVNRSKPLVLAGAQAVLSDKPVSLTAFHSARLEAWVQKTIRTRTISAIVIFSGQMGQYVPTDFAGQVVIDLCDVDSAKFESYAAAGGRVWLNAREGRMLAREEARLAARANAITLISHSEADLLRSRLGHDSDARIEVLGNGIDASLFDPIKVLPHPAFTVATGPHLVFTGQMDYPPNEAAAVWAIEHLLPAVRQRCGGAVLHIVGRNPTSALLRHTSSQGVRIWGEVPDVKPYIAAATCVIAPLLIARGVQNKVLEAMAMARPVVLSPEAATGIDASDGVHWLVSEADPAAMADKIAALVVQPERAAVIGAAARRFVLEHHAWEAMLAPLGALVMGEGAEREAEARNAA